MPVGQEQHLVLPNAHEAAPVTIGRAVEVVGSFVASAGKGDASIRARHSRMTRSVPFTSADSEGGP